MAFTLPSGPRGDSPSAKGRRKKSRASVGKAITKAGSSPPKPTPKPKAGARSTGKTIQRTGATLKPTPQRKPPVSSAFGNKPLAKADFREQRREQRDKVRGAADRMPQRVRLPRLPLLREYNEQQRQAIIDMTTDAVQRGIRAERSKGGSAQSALRKAFELDNEDGQRRLGGKETRRALNKLAGAVDTRKTEWVDGQFDRALDRAKGASINGTVYTRPDVDRLSRAEKVQIFNDAQANYMANSTSEAKPGKPMAKVEAMGISVPVGAITRAAGDRIFSGQGKSAQKWARLATAPVVATDEAIRNPGPTAKSSAKMAIATAKGAIPGAIQAVTDPKKAAKQTGEAYKRLYGPLMEGRTGEFRRQVRDEGAGVQVAFDTATVASGVGRVAGLGAKAGVAGKTAKALMTDNRPMLRTGAGARQVRRQQVSGNIFKAAGQRAVDRNRRRAQRKDAARPDGARGLQPAAGRTETEVVKASKMAQRKDQRVDVAKTRARGFVRLTRLQDAEIRDKNTGLRGARKQAHKAAGDKQLAADLETLTLQGLTSRDVKTTREVLTQLRDRQLRERAKAADAGDVRTPGKNADDVARIDRVLAADDSKLEQALAAMDDYRKGERQRDERILGRDETGLTKERAQARRYGPLAIALNLDEELAKFTKRIDDAVDAGDMTKAEAEALKRDGEREMVAYAQREGQKRGLGEPVYVEHRASSRTRFGDFASGPTAVRGWSPTEFKLFREGRYDTTPDAYEAGQARTIKNTVNWNTAADILERQSAASGLTLQGAREYIRRNGLDERDYSIVDMNIVRKARESAPDERVGDVDNSGALGDAIDHATVGNRNSKVGMDTVDTAGNPGDFRQGGGTFIVAPRGVVEEITKEVRAGNPVSRGFQKLQGVTSGLILSTSPLFVPIQVASNIALAVPGSRGRILKAPYRKWRKEIEAQGTDPATLGMIDEYLGASPMSELSRSPKFGGSTENRLAAFYQMMADSKAVEAARETKWNPLTWNRRMDKAQNDFFRREAFFAKLERDMKSRSNAIAREAEQLADALRMPPGQEKIQALRAAEPAMERIAGHVDDMLGNWTAYTARERALGKSAVLFYGFMRFATKLALYHLPVNHPIVTNILRQLGQLNMQDVEDLLSAEFLRDGRKNGYTEDEVRRAIRRELISQFGGRIYFTRGGHLGYVDLARITPLTSPIFDLIADPRSGTFNLMSPALGSIAEILLKERSSGAKLNTHGLFTKFGEEPKIDLGDGVRIFMRDMTRTVPALRTLDDTLGTGGSVQGDDSLPFLDDRPLTPLTERQQQRADRTTKGSSESAALRAAQSLFTPVKLNDTTSLSRVQQSADYPELDRLKYELQQEQKRLKDAGQIELVSPKTKELKQRIGFIETRAGIRPKRKKKTGTFGGLGGGGGSFGGLGGGRNGFGGL